MHPLRKLRESGNPTPAQVSELLAENIVFNSPILVRPIEGREVNAGTRLEPGDYQLDAVVKDSAGSGERMYQVHFLIK
jgi:hypothetical protein